MSKKEVHDALCYSFSGMCLFRSFIGGRGANRGLCAQSCRRDYRHKNESKFLFNLKDNQLLDFGRQKTDYFIGGNLRPAISAETSTGILLGKVEKVERNNFLIFSEMEIQSRFRLRILDESRNEPIHVVVKNCKREGAFYRIDKNNEIIKTGSLVYLTKLQEQAFFEKLEITDSSLPAPVSGRYKKSILGKIKGNRAVEVGEGEEELYFRIDLPEWFSRINFNELDGLFLQFSKTIWTRFDASDPFILNNRSKIFIELPKFSAEDVLDFYAELVKKMVGHGIRNFIISHLSQKMLIPENCRIITSENVYAFNDAAITFFQNEAIENLVYPVEIDFETLESITHKNKLGKMGFSRYLIDVSYETFSKNRLKTLKTRFLKSEQIQPSTTFNFVKGLKLNKKSRFNFESAFLSFP